MQLGRLRLAAVTGGLTPQPIQRLVAGSGHDPAARVGRNTRRRPALSRHGKGLLDRLLGEVDIAEEADQGGHRPPRALPVGPLQGGSVRTRHALLLRDLLEGPDLHRRSTGGGSLGRPVERGVQVGGLDDPETAQLLLGLRERPVGGDDLAALGANDRGRAWRVQAAREHPRPRRLELGVERVDRLVCLLCLRARAFGLSLDHVHGEQVLLHVSSPFVRPAPSRLSSCSRTGAAAIDIWPMPVLRNAPLNYTPGRWAGPAGPAVFPCPRRPRPCRAAPPGQAAPLGRPRHRAGACHRAGARQRGVVRLNSQPACAVAGGGAIRLVSVMLTPGASCTAHTTVWPATMSTVSGSARSPRTWMSVPCSRRPSHSSWPAAVSAVATRTCPRRLLPLASAHS